MKKIMFVTLFNSALNDKDEYRLMNIAETDLKGSVAIGGSEELKALIRERFEDLFNGDILEYFDSVDVTDEDVDYCINELAIGHASNIAGEDFYWGDAEELIIDISEPTGNKKVYAVAEHVAQNWGDEVDCILGVYSTREKAEQAATKRFNEFVGEYKESDWEEFIPDCWYASHNIGWSYCHIDINIEETEVK